MTRTSTAIVLAAAAVFGGASLSVRAADTDDETPPPAFDKEAGYRRRYADLPPETRMRYSHLSAEARPAAKYERTGPVITIGKEDEIPILKPTLVTLALKGVTAREAATELGKAAGIKIRSMPPGYFGNQDLPKVTLELDKKPALEALLEFASQTGTHPMADNFGKLTFHEGESDKAAGIWCTTGPFAFVITRIERIIPLGTFNAGNSGARITMEFLAEPRLQVLSFPGQLDVEIMQDEHGKNLTANVAANPRSALPRQPGRQLTVPMNIPADAGSRIKIFRASGNFTVQTEGKALEFTFGAAAQEKFAGAISVNVSPLTSRLNQWTASVTINRNQCPAATWEGLATVLQNVRPQAFDEAGKPVADFGTQQGKRSGDTFAITANWYRDPSRPAPAKMIINVPTNIQDVTVPLVFRDLMLP